MEPITIVTVVPEGDGFRLDHPAEDLWIAYEVVRRHVDADGVRHYAQLTGAKMTSEGYEFTFDTGDVFSCSSATDYPVSDTVSDESGGGSGGGVLVVNVNEAGVLDKTWQEIHDAFVSGGAVVDKEGTHQNAAIGVGSNKGTFFVTFASQPNWIPGTFVSDAADGYPVEDN